MRRPLSVTEHGTLPVDPGREDALTPDEAGRCERIAEARPGFCVRRRAEVRFAQYAGLVHLGDRMLEVLPKVEGSNASIAECRGIFLRLLRRAPNLPVHVRGTASHALRSGALLEHFLSAFFEELEHLLRAGLLRRYDTREEDLAVVRGRLDTRRQTTVLALRPDRLACRYRRLTADQPWNQVLKAALGACRGWLTSTALRRRWIALWAAFDGVSVPDRIAPVLATLLADRQTLRYAAAIRWARWILACHTPALRAGDAAAPAMLFDTNALFEQAVATALRSLLPRQGDPRNVRTQARERSLARAEDSGRPSVRLRPDIVIEQDGRLEAIVDTKWKRLAVAHGHARPHPGDVHQMLAYAAAFRCARLVLLYPRTEEFAYAASTVLRLPDFGDLTPRLELAWVDVGEDALPFGVEDLRERPMSPAHGAMAIAGVSP